MVLTYINSPRKMWKVYSWSVPQYRFVDKYKLVSISDSFGEPFQISDVDDLPQQLCPGCFLKCLAWSNFKNLCHETNSRLEEQLKVGDTECEDLNIAIQEYVSDTPVDEISPEPLNNVEADSNEQDTTISESPRSNTPAQKLVGRSLIIILIQR